MGGNRKHGYLRGNGGGFKGSPWFCDGCQKMHPYSRERNGIHGTGKSYCNRTYYAMLKENGVSK